MNQDCDVIHKTTTNAMEPMSIFYIQSRFDLHSLFDEEMKSAIVDVHWSDVHSLRCSLNVF